MAISNKQKKTVIILAIIIISIIIFAVFNVTSTKLSENWIIGRSSNEIEERYGEFDLNFENKSAYEIPEDFFDRVWRYFMGGTPINYYYIEFDENGMAEKVYIAPYPGG